jgi:hypothetical protein
MSRYSKFFGRFAAGSVFVAVASIGIMSCGEKNKSKKASAQMEIVLRTVSSNSARAMAQAELTRALVNSDTTDFTTGVPATQWDSLGASFVPASFLYPIGTISGRESVDRAGGPIIYTCAGSTLADCQVDLADSAAVEALLKDARLSVTKEVEPGVDAGVLATIGGFDFDRCLPSDTNAKYKIKGTTVFQGTTWYTTSKDGKVLTMNAADYDYVEIDAGGCGTPPYLLPKPIELKEGDSVKVSLLVSLDDVSSMRFFADNNVAAECKTQAGLRRVCANDSKPVPYAGDVQAKVEVYQLAVTDVENNNETRGAKLILFIDPATNEPVGATCRSYYDGTNVRWTRCPGDIVDIKKNDSGTYSFSIFTTADVTNPVESVTTFQRATHSGSMKVKINSDGTTMTFPYTATKIQ